MHHARVQQSVDFALPLWSFSFTVDRLRIVVVIIGGIQLLLARWRPSDSLCSVYWMHSYSSGFWGAIQFFLRDPRIPEAHLSVLFQFGDGRSGWFWQSFRWALVLLTDAQAQYAYVFRHGRRASPRTLGSPTTTRRDGFGLSMYQDWAHCHETPDRVLA